MKKILLCFAMMIFSVLPVSAKTVISGLSWETSPAPLAGVKASTAAVYSEVSDLHIKGISFDRLRAVVSLNNSAEKKEMGIVIRYAFRLQVKNEESGESFWEVPYQADAVRVPVVKAGITRDAKIISIKLKEHIKSLQNTGFTPIALKLEVMLAPRMGVSEDGRIAEAILPIIYEPAPAKKKIIKFPALKKNNAQTKDAAQNKEGEDSSSKEDK